MREILFRGKRVENGEWVEGDLLQNVDCLKTREQEVKIKHIARSFVIIPETVGQYTGLTDKNGKKIFEGDIVKATYDCECEKIYQVIFFNGGYKMKANDCHTVYDYSIHEEHPDFEVIGNIHDNPDLLGEVI